MTAPLPGITLQDLTAKSKTERVPVAVMYDLARGPKDTHFGNNVALPMGHHFRIVVTIAGQRAAFAVSG